MGLEATCFATLDGERGRGKALLETTELLFRATSGGWRARVPFAELDGVKASGKTLTLEWSGHALALELGADAARWAEKIKNPPSRLSKLGVRPASRVALVGDFGFDETFERELGMAASADGAATVRGPVDVLFYAPATPNALGRVAVLSKRLHPAGALWIVRPKGKDTPITEDATRRAGLGAGLVDVKVAAFSATHSALKFVIPVAKRPSPPPLPETGGGRVRSRGR
ncbi:MAG TPA: hypothetical protein VHL80_09060 [Polyangia bacterium]|nr:hypothetical protein [Polyangia bacterium]